MSTITIATGVRYLDNLFNTAADTQSQLVAEKSARLALEVALASEKGARLALEAALADEKKTTAALLAAMEKRARPTEVAPKDKEILRFVVRPHTPYPTYQCPLCREQFSSEYRLRCHRDRQHASVANNFQCPRCPAHFSTSYALKSHRTLEHAPPQGNIECGYCKQLFVAKAGLVRHVKTLHMGDPACHVKLNLA